MPSNFFIGVIMTLSDMSIQLSYKLRDVVISDDDGSVFSKLGRYKYLESAFKKLKRILSVYVPDLAFVFAKNTKTISLNLTADKAELPSDCSKVISVFSTVSSVKVKLNYIRPENFVSIEQGITSPYYTSSESSYTILDGNIVVNGVDLSSSLSVYYEAINFIFSHDSKDLNVPISSEYEDMLLTLAAFEAMLDEGSQMSLAKAGAYNNEFNQQLQLLAPLRQLDREGGKV